MSETPCKESCEPEERSTDDRHSSNENYYTPKKLSPGMKMILQEEIKSILRDVEEQLKDFASLIEEVQIQTPSEWELLMVSPLETDSNSPRATFASNSSRLIHPPMRSIQTVDAKPSNAPLRDAFQIVRNLLSKLSHLINHVSLSTNADDEECENVQVPHFEVYYSQYVFQIAIFVLQIVGKKLTQFGETLSEFAIQEPIEPIHVLDDNIRSHPAAFSILHHKGHTFCSSQLNDTSGPSAMMSSSGKIESESTLPATTRKHPISDYELRKSITDALGVLECLSEKLYKKENPPYVCYDCRINSVSASRIGCCDSCSALYGEQKTNSPNFFEDLDLIREGRNSGDPRLKSSNGSSNQIVDPKFAHSLKSMPEKGVNFNIDLFSSRLKDELRGIISQDSHTRKEKSVQSDSIMLLNCIIQCFREATENFDTGMMQSHGNFKERGAQLEYSSREADVEDNITHDEKPPVKQTISTTKEEQFDEAVEKFVEETYKLAVTSMNRTRTCSTLALMINSADVVSKEYECKGKDCEDDSHLVSVFVNGYPSNRDDNFRLSNFSVGQSLWHLFRESPPTTMEGSQEVRLCSEECYRGHMLHQFHDHLPSGVMEIREINLSGELIVSLGEWIKEDEGVEEYELISSLMHMGLTRNEGTSKEPVNLKKKLRVSTATSNLSLVDASAGKNVCPDKAHSSTYLQKEKSNTSELTPIGFAAVEMPTLKEKGFKPLKDRNPVPSRYKADIDKLWRFFDDLQKLKYCIGPPLLLRLRRNSILDDAFQTIMVPSRIRLNYYRCMKINLSEDDIIYKNFSSFGRSKFEDDVDITDSFFPLIARELFSPYRLSLFHYPSEESSFLYPNPTTPTHIEWFKFSGMILAFSFLYQKPLEMQFPQCFFKCLLNRPMNVKDLEEIDPHLYKKMMWLKETDLTDRKNTFTFTVREKMGSIAYYAELVENGNSIEVTEENKQEYIAKCVKWKLAEQCLMQFQEIRRGFVSILDPKLLDRFKEEELQYMTEKALDCLSSEENIKEKELLRRETL